MEQCSTVFLYSLLYLCKVQLMGHLSVSYDCQVVQWTEVVSGYRNQVTRIMAQREMEKPSFQIYAFYIWDKTS
jgi:hypothetical protein